MANSKQNIQIPRPSLEEVGKYIKKFKNDETFKTKKGKKDLEHYREQEQAINHLFDKYRRHDMRETLVKVTILNDFYSTNLIKLIGYRGTYQMSRHIVEIDKKTNLSQRIENGCESVIKEIAEIPLKDEKEANAQGKKTRNVYSFATKYCANHNPEKYPIYDSFVDKMLNYFRKNDKDFASKCTDSLKNIGKKFTSANDLKDYSTLKAIIEAFKSHYGLEKFGFREIDWYLWLAGQEYFE